MMTVPGSPTNFLEEPAYEQTEEAAGAIGQVPRVLRALQSRHV